MPAGRSPVAAGGRAGRPGMARCGAAAPVRVRAAPPGHEPSPPGKPPSLQSIQDAAEGDGYASIMGSVDWGEQLRLMGPAPAGAAAAEALHQGTGGARSRARRPGPRHSLACGSSSHPTCLPRPSLRPLNCHPPRCRRPRV